MTSHDCLKGAYSALMRGDTAERDRLCSLGEKMLKVEQQVSAIRKVLEVDFYVTRAGISIPTGDLLAALL